MTYNISDANRNGEIVARISSNNGKNALKRFLRECCMSTGFYEIRKGKHNWRMFSSFGSAFYAIPQQCEESKTKKMPIRCISYWKNEKEYRIAYDDECGSVRVTKRLNKDEQQFVEACDSVFDSFWTTTWEREGELAWQL